MGLEKKFSIKSFDSIDANNENLLQIKMKADLVIGD